MKKIIFSFLASAGICTMASAQKLEDGIKFLYYERTTSAKDVFKKLVASNPKDAQSNYWLGQAYIDADQVDSAKTIYQNALTAGINDPWIWVGAAETDVLKGGDINAAKQKFEQAITATTSNRGKNKGPNADILNAIGRAMAEGSSTQGDANYGIDKLKQAAQIDAKNPDILVNLGICYLKLGGDHGGEAFEAFRQATTINPQYAKAYERIGRVYRSQRNKESMDEWFGKAIAADATYAPVYLQYFLYYSERDVNAAKQYLDKWVANADKDCKSQFFVGDYLFRAGKYQDALQQAKTMDAGGCGTSYPRTNVLYAYVYDRLGDSVQAKSYITKYLTTGDTATIQPSDYALAGTVFAKFPNGGDSAASYLQKAIAKDTVKENQTGYLNSAVNVATSSNNYGMLMSLMGSMQKLTGAKLSETQFFNIAKGLTDAVSSQDSMRKAGSADSSLKQFDSSKYLMADSVLKSYIAAYPDKPQPYSFQTRFAKLSDIDSTRGLAIPAIAQQNEFLAKDTAASNKQTIFSNDVYLLIHYAQYATGEKADNYKKAIDIANQMEALYPDSGSEQYKYAQGIKDQLQSALDKYEKAKNAPPAKSTPSKTTPSKSGTSKSKGK